MNHFMAELGAQGDMVLVPFGSSILVIERATFLEALANGQKLMGGSATMRRGEEKEATVLDADGISKRTGVPASWFLEAARRGKIPHLAFGKYIRFSLDDVVESLTILRGHKVRRAYVPEINEQNHQVENGCRKMLNTAEDA